MNVIQTILVVLTGLVVGVIHAVLFEKSIRARYQNNSAGGFVWIKLVGSKVLRYGSLGFLGYCALQLGMGIFLAGVASFMIGFWLTLYKSLRGAA